MNLDNGRKDADNMKDQVVIKLTKESHTICRDTKYAQLEDPKKGSELRPVKPISNGNY